MVIGIFGDSCVGKSTIAQKLSDCTNARIVSGKDYLRLAKNENIATEMFKKQLEAAMEGEENIIYVLTERELLPLLPPGCVRVLVVAPLEKIKERFAQRMHGNLPDPVAAMLERKYGQFEKETYDLRIDTEMISPEQACEEILKCM